jgi:hypothetical protein
MSPPAIDFDRLDPTRLSDHFRQCRFARGPLHRLRCMAEALDAFLAPRFVTTLALLTMVVLLVGAALPA